MFGAVCRLVCISDTVYRVLCGTVEYDHCPTAGSKSVWRDAVAGHYFVVRGDISPGKSPHTRQLEGRKEIFYLTTHSTHFIYGYMASDIWLRTILKVRKETHCRHTGYSFRLAARVILYAPSHRQDSIYHRLCYTSRGALAGTRNSSAIGTGG